MYSLAPGGQAGAVQAGLVLFCPLSSCGCTPPPLFPPKMAGPTAKGEPVLLGPFMVSWMEGLVSDLQSSCATMLQ